MKIEENEYEENCLNRSVPSKITRNDDNQFFLYELMSLNISFYSFQAM